MRTETRLFESGSWSLPLPSELDSDQTVVTFFASPGMADTPAVGALREAFPRARIIGCSTAGEIFQDRIHDDVLVAAIARFDSVTSDVATAATDATNSRSAGETIARKLLRPGLRAIFLLSEGLRVNGSQLVEGINVVIPPGVVVTGGLGGDGPRFQRTWVSNGQGAASDCVVALGLYGERLAVSHGSKGGWDIFGPERRVTRSVGNVLYELDGKPALMLYKQYLGERASGLPATALLFPLAVRASAGDDKQLVRTVLSIDEDEQTMTFAGDIPTGALAQLMRANFDRIISGASDAASSAVLHDAASPILSLAISCIGRRLVLGERAEEEVEATLEVLPEGTRQIGFYSYGEISPFGSGRCDLHNQTMTLTTFSER